MVIRNMPAKDETSRMLEYSKFVMISIDSPIKPRTIYRALSLGQGKGKTTKRILFFDPHSLMRTFLDPLFSTYI
jgi:hypothetical protein